MRPKTCVMTIMLSCIFFNSFGQNTEISTPINAGFESAIGKEFYDLFFQNALFTKHIELTLPPEDSHEYYASLLSNTAMVIHGGSGFENCDLQVLNFLVTNQFATVESFVTKVNGKNQQLNFLFFTDHLKSLLVNKSPPKIIVGNRKLKSIDRFKYSQPGTSDLDQNYFINIEFTYTIVPKLIGFPPIDFYGKVRAFKTSKNDDWTFAFYTLQDDDNAEVIKNFERVESPYEVKSILPAAPSKQKTEDSLNRWFDSQAIYYQINHLGLSDSTILIKVPLIFLNGFNTNQQFRDSLAAQLDRNPRIHRAAVDSSQFTLLYNTDSITNTRYRVVNGYGYRASFKVLFNLTSASQPLIKFPFSSKVKGSELHYYVDTMEAITNALHFLKYQTDQYLSGVFPITSRLVAVTEVDKKDAATTIKIKFSKADGISENMRFDVYRVQDMSYIGIVKVKNFESSQFSVCRVLAGGDTIAKYFKLNEEILLVSEKNRQSAIKF